eukprot:1531713-Prymnesium_polylepis.1
MKDCAGLDVVHAFIELGYTAAKRRALAQAVAAAEAREAEATSGLRELIASKLTLEARQHEACQQPSGAPPADKDWLGRPTGARTPASAVVPKLDAPPSAGSAVISPAPPPATKTPPASGGLQFSAHPSPAQPAAAPSKPPIELPGLSSARPLEPP